MGQTKWQNILQEFDEEVSNFSKVVLQPKAHAKHINANESDALLKAEIFSRSFESGKLPDGPVYYPYIEGIHDAVAQALSWLKQPPVALRIGLLLLAEEKTPENLAEIFQLYGEFKEHLGVLYAKDHQFGAFERDRAAGESKGDFALKIYAASYMLAVMRGENANIQGGRNALINHAVDIAFNGKTPPEGFETADFRKLLFIPPLKPGQKLSTAAEISERFRQALTEPKLIEWADELLIFKIQEYDIRP